MKTKSEVDAEITRLRKMIEWAEKRSKVERVSHMVMLTEIGVNMWSATCCDLNADCDECLLTTITVKCDEDGSFWISMVRARTWGEWVTAAKKMLAVLEKVKERAE